jgi:50S ribosomal protein L16 3-hydroxylase
MPEPRLAHLPAGEFLRRYWQKRPVLLRGALPQHAQLVGREQLFELAQRDDLESRIVMRRGRRWSVRYGPFAARELARLPRAGWTLLVLGVERALPRAHELLAEFAFVPRARLDDLMVSYAPPGGGVGPHYDSYDVFLLQGEGRRRWRVSRQRDLALVAGAPLRLLRRFRPEHEWLLQPGDLLYLPPRCAHDGVAVADCITYSIGFRAPSAKELANRFLEYLQDHLEVPGEYRDPDLRPARRPAHLDDATLQRMRKMLAALRWSRADVVRFLGAFLTEPAPEVVFRRPVRPLSPAAFARRIAREGIRLAPQSRMLYRGATVFVNGEAYDVGTAAARLRPLADARALPPGPLDRACARWLYRWYRAGYIESGKR